MITVKRLDDVVDGDSLGKVGIKIDTEGHELEVLEGSQNYIARDKPDLIFEINESCFDNCLGILKNHEYKFYFINENDKKLIKPYDNFSVTKNSPAKKSGNRMNIFFTYSRGRQISINFLIKFFKICCLLITS